MIPTKASLTLSVLLVSFLTAATAVAGGLRDTISLTLSTDKAQYEAGSTVNVKSIARYRDGSSVRSFSVKTVSIVNPAGVTVVDGAGMNASRGVLTYAYALPRTAPAGDWRVTVRVADGSGVTATATKTFAVTTQVTPPPNGSPHSNLNWADYPKNCRGCHPEQFTDVFFSVHYQWQAPAPDNINRRGTLQGKMTNALNSYCISILGDWTHCGKCHVGRGAQPVYSSAPSESQLDNIDCLVCHSESYAMARVRRSDGSMGPASTDPAVLNSYVRSVAKPTRANCLKCHAYAGGGDGYKRGDIAWAHKSTADGRYDVHMATTGANLACQSCHTFNNHKVTGKGSDLQASDGAAEVACTRCHADRATASGHSDPAIGRHVARVACQTCHIPTYAKDAGDTPATEATEYDRDWRTTHSTAAPYHPDIKTANNLIPRYRWWNRTSDTYLLGDSAKLDPATGAYATSRPVGAVNGAIGTKLYPFKYKTATQPMRTLGNVLIALDTWEYIWVSANPALSTQKGLANMGFSPTDAYSWVKTDTFQLLNHEIGPADAPGAVLSCASCHGSTTRINLKGELGYSLKGSAGTVCTQCHGQEDDNLSFTSLHKKHVTDKKYDCNWCHSFSRPERGLRSDPTP